MPSNFLSADVSFPTFTGQESTQDKVEALQNYMYMLLEQLRYTLFNLDFSNMNQTAVKEFSNYLTEPVYARLEEDNGKIAELALTALGLGVQLSDAEGRIAALALTTDGFGVQLSDAQGKISDLRQTVDGFSLVVSNGAESSLIQLRSGSLVISSANIAFSGMVTFAGLATSGATYINGDNIRTGTISAINMIGNNIIGGNISGAAITGGTLTSSGAYGERVTIHDGRITFNDSASLELYYDWNTGVSTISSPLSGLKISTLLNMSIDAGAAHTIYIGTSYQNEGVTIGNGSTTIRLVGNVYINGVLQ